MLSGAPYISACLTQTLGGFGPIFIAIAMVLFAFTTLIGNLFYVDKAVLHLMGKEPSKIFKTIYYIVFSLLIFLGAGLNAGLLWDISDIFMGCMAIINVPVIIILGKYSIRALNDYIKQKKAGKTPTFLASSIGLTDKVDYWQEQSEE